MVSMPLEVADRPHRDLVHNLQGHWRLHFGKEVEVLVVLTEGCPFVEHLFGGLENREAPTVPYTSGTFHLCPV